MLTCPRWMQSVRWYRSGACPSASSQTNDEPDTLDYPVSVIHRSSSSVERRETYHLYPSCFDLATGSSCQAPAAEPIMVRSPVRDPELSLMTADASLCTPSSSALPRVLENTLPDYLRADCPDSEGLAGEDWKLYGEYLERGARVNVNVRSVF